LAQELTTSLPAVGLMASGTSPRLVTNVGIRGNSFANFTFRGIQFTTGTGNNIFIQNNHFFYNATPAFTSTGYNAIDFFNNYKKELKISDVHNKLLIVSALIKDIIKKYYLKDPDKFSKEIERRLDFIEKDYIKKKIKLLNVKEQLKNI
jgi:hypothetical protein